MDGLKAKTYELRQNALDIVMSGRGGHIGGDMSVIDILSTLYFRIMNISPELFSSPLRDRFVMSKGHSVEALYAVLAEKGFFPLEEVLEQFSRFGSPVMENKAQWHHKVPTKEEYIQISRDFAERKERFLHE